MNNDIIPSVPFGAFIRQASQACFYDLVSSSPVFVQVCSGTKMLHWGNEPLYLVEGDFCLLPDHQPLTMENIPKVSQNYEARVLPVPRALFEETYTRLASISLPHSVYPMKAESLPAEAVALFDFFCFPENLAALPEAVAKIRLMELITWFALSGAVLGKPGGLRLQNRLRELIETDSARDWVLGDVARAFHMSEATLRRKLAAENTSFTETLRDVRMTRALGLLQTTLLPIAHIAQKIGYDSPSQFAARFKDRFGINPRDLRERPADIERIGIEVERIETNEASA